MNPENFVNSVRGVLKFFFLGGGGGASAYFTEGRTDLPLEAIGLVQLLLEGGLYQYF